MKIIVTSDTHSRKRVLNQISKYYKDADYYLNLGDLQDDDINDYRDWIFVQGNCDRYNEDFFNIPTSRVITFPGHRLLMLHGHKLNPYTFQSDLIEMGKIFDCDIVCYGHTHITRIEEEQGILFINPGSLNRPKNGNECSYCVLDIDGDKVSPTIVFESEWPFKK
ncbi:MAG: metallophosphoesterase [Firmicutes bacterium]|nr:metallophosphoesterase [Bacillota bacterium]